MSRASHKRPRGPKTVRTSAPGSRTAAQTGRAALPQLEPADIIATTLKLARRTGFARLSMRQIAAELNVTATALYYHFRDKTALLEAVSEHIMDSGEIPDRRLPWTRRLKELILWQQRTMLDFPGLANFIVMHRESAAGLRWMEMIYRVLDDAGFRGTNATRALGTLSFFVHPLTLADDHPHTGRQLMMRNDWLRSRVAREPERYPSLGRFLPSLGDYSFDTFMPIALDRIIAGLAVELERTNRKR